MRRFSELFIWIPILALLVLFLSGVFYSFVIPEDRIRIETHRWSTK